MQPWPPHSYSFNVLQDGGTAALASVAIERAHKLQYGSPFLPAVLTLNHLATMADVPLKFLRRICRREFRVPYREYKVQKRSGGKRRILVPVSSLRQVQRWIDRQILKNIPPHPHSFAYSSGRGHTNCAKMHLGCRWLIKLDLVNFFESIDERLVFKVFNSQGYSPLVSFELARLATHILREHGRPVGTLHYSDAPYQSYHLGVLPQGAPTSPRLSNLVAKGVDESLTACAEESNLTYTRYSDDIQLSTADPSFTREQARHCVSEAIRAIHAQGFVVNRKKTSIAGPTARRLVLGLLVDGQELHLPKPLRKRLTQHVYFAEKDVVAHFNRRGFVSFEAFRQHIYGLVRYAVQVHPSFGQPLLDRLNQIDWPA